MSHKFLFNTTFHRLLTQMDQELAEQMLQQGCPYCGHKLHLANYPRSPMGLPAQFRNHYEERFSFCCDTCRKRTTPPSVRFFGRRCYPAPLFLLISAIKIAINEGRFTQLKRHLGIVVSESTWKRWRRWWREQFMATLFWQKEKGLVLMAIGTSGSFPRRLLVVFQGALEEKMLFLLRFLSPLTGGVLRAV